MSLKASQRASMLCTSLNEDGLLTYSSLFVLNFFSPILMFLVFLNLAGKIFGKFPTFKSCDKDNVHPSRDAALLYSPLHGSHGNFLIGKTASYTGAGNICLY